MAGAYEPERVYLLRRETDRVALGELVDHQYADETPVVEQACVYVALVDGAGRVYIQHRAATKRLWPDRKTISASGHVDPGETFEQAAVREVEEELGLRLSQDDLRPVGFFTGLSHGGPVYEVRCDQIPTPDPRELDPERSRFLCDREVEGMLTDPHAFTPAGARALRIWLADRRGQAGL
jgi:8-oxo-dGTP pyrophosphatase MutT (NUDIX family)